MLLKELAYFKHWNKVRFALNGIGYGETPLLALGKYL